MGGIRIADKWLGTKICEEKLACGRTSHEAQDLHQSSCLNFFY